MADEERIRVETPEEEEKAPEKKGLLRPLPTREEPQYRDKDGRPQPIVKLLGFSMSEKRRDLLMLLMIPAFIGYIDTVLYTFIVMHIFPNNLTYLFIIPVIIAIPIGLTSSEASNALIGGFLGSIFFLLFFITFLSTPGILIPELDVADFIINAIAISIIYFIVVTIATLLGAMIGMIIREFF